MQHLWSDPATLRGQIFLNASPESLFAFFANLEHIPKWHPWVKHLTMTGDTAQATYAMKVAGITIPLNFPVTVRLTNVQEPATLTLHATGMVQGSLQWTFQPQEHGTLVIAQVKYQLSRTVIGGVLTALANLLAANAWILEQVLTNLQTLNFSGASERKTQILLVEDNKAIQELLTIFLGRLGVYNVVLASTGVEALNKLQLFRPDLLLLDYHLPDLNGLQIYDQLHAQRDALPLPTVLMSATPLGTTLPTSELAKRRIIGLQKPFLLGQLREAMIQAFFTYFGENEAPSSPSPTPSQD